LKEKTPALAVRVWPLPAWIVEPSGESVEPGLGGVGVGVGLGVGLGFGVGVGVGVGFEVELGKIAEALLGPESSTVFIPPSHPHRKAIGSVSINLR